MTFRDWQQLTPAAAARELHHRVLTRLAPAQQKAAIARLCPEDELSGLFAAADPTAPLGRVPYFAKDLFDAAGAPTLAGSTFLPEVRPTSSQDGAMVRAMAATGATRDPAGRARRKSTVGRCRAAGGQPPLARASVPR